jgi:AraC family transcriptional regulator
MRPDLSLSLQHYRPGAVLDDHEHRRGSIGIIIGGLVEERAGGREAQGRIGDVVVKPPGLVHRNRFGPQGALLVSIAGAPRSAFARGWRWFGGGGFARRAVAAAIALRQGDPFGAGQEAAWELLDLAQGSEAQSPAPGLLPWLPDVGTPWRAIRAARPCAGSPKKRASTRST